MINIEYYEVGSPFGDDPLAYVCDGIVPRIGERIHLSRTEKVLGLDPEKEHRYWKVVDVELWVNALEDQTLCIKYGRSDNVSVWLERVEDPYELYHGKR